jgi:hypothetical protein
MSPQELLRTTGANINEFECSGFEEMPRRLQPSRIRDKVPSGPSKKASLLYEIWDNQQRKMRIVIPSILPKKAWTHVCITAKSDDAFRPDIGIYVNGELAYLEASGFLPQASSLSNCYLGRSNWASSTSQYENKDELFKGSLFDIRGYKVVLTDKVIQESVAWGKNFLGIQN